MGRKNNRWKLPPASRKKECEKFPYSSQMDAFRASLEVPVGEDGKQPIATYQCPEHKYKWHYTSKSQIKDRNRGARRNRRR